MVGNASRGRILSPPRHAKGSVFGCAINRRRRRRRSFRDGFRREAVAGEGDVAGLVKRASALVEVKLGEIEEQAAALRADASAASTSRNQEWVPKITTALDVLSAGLIERDTEVRLLLLGALCGEHVLFLGPPGTAKSELGRRLSKICEGGVFFERLLTRFSVPEELFGPLSMQALEQDQYLRQVEGYLPDATVAFVDEIFKANSAILNALLTILNERLFDNGTERLSVPLVCLVGASNELPESEELDALYDRFLIRKEVSQVSKEGMADLLTGKMGAGTDGYGGAAFTEAEFATIREAAMKIHVPSVIVDILCDLRMHLQDEIEPPIYVSDRRLLKAVNFLRVAAYTCGRESVSEFDCMLLKHVLWQKPAEREAIAKWMVDRSTALKMEGLEQIQYMLAGMFGRACRSMDKVTSVKAANEEEGGGMEKEILQAEEELQGLIDEVRGIHDLVRKRLVECSVSSLSITSIITKHLWLSEDDKGEMVEMAAPLQKKAERELHNLLSETTILQTALEDCVEPVVLAELLPAYWSAFIRKGDIADIRKIGLN